MRSLPMYRSHSLSVCLATTLLLVAVLRTQTNSHTADQTAIRAVVDRYVAARDQIDEKAIAALFTADADQLVSSGEWRKGHDDVVRGTVASSKNESGKRTITVENIRFVGQDVAIADGRYEIASQNGAANRKMWSTLILQKTREGWKIAAIRNMLPAPPAGAPAR